MIGGTHRSGDHKSSACMKSQGSVTSMGSDGALLANPRWDRWHDRFLPILTRRTGRQRLTLPSPELRVPWNMLRFVMVLEALGPG